tara:strand:- start:17 stop:367 length:351 start_codon:yes stop_codon:yes gene_type:complete
VKKKADVVILVLDFWDNPHVYADVLMEHVQKHLAEYVVVVMGLMKMASPARLVLQVAMGIAVDQKMVVVGVTIQNQMRSVQQGVLQTNILMVYQLAVMVNLAWIGIVLIVLMIVVV